MTEEENKIQIINNFILYCRGFEERKYTDKELFTAIEDISILIQNQQSEIERKEHEYRDLELKYNQNLKFLKHFREELQKQDKMIDLMAKAWKQDDSRTVEEIKQYFEKQVEKE